MPTSSHPGAFILLNQNEKRSYLLRLWSTQFEGQVVWRASLVCIPGGEVLGFGSLAQCFEYLEGECQHLNSSNPLIQIEKGDFNNETRADP